MGLWTAVATFEGEIPSAEALAREMQRISGVEVEITEDGDSATIRWALTGESYIDASRVEVRRSRIVNPKRAADARERLLLTKRGDYGEGTLVGFALIALERLGGKVAAPHENMGRVRERCGGTLTVAILKSRMRRRRVLNTLMMPVGAVAIFFVAIYMLILIPFAFVRVFSMRRERGSDVF